VIAAMPQPIAGVSPPDLQETTVMTVWPSIASTGAGRFIGRLCGNRLGAGFFTLGKLFALVSIPLAVGLYFALRLPFRARRYTLTNRRVVVRKGLTAKDERWVELDRFDSIVLDVLPGQQWFPAGDLVFKNGAVETFRLEAVRHPEAFRRTCLKARMGYVGARRAMGLA
jgi:hypothetical protein